MGMYPMSGYHHRPKYFGLREASRHKPMCHFNLMDVQERHITNSKFRDSGVHGQFDRSSLPWKMTVGVGGVCSITSEVLASLNKGVPTHAYFDWIGWFRAGLSFFQGDMILRCSFLILPHGSR
ncbi:hypothetical protein J6590_064245 [Homalodisca vitripennis]|nr:hypothetical protein J6590_064245 [Homalodisca vitripennis]